MCRGRRRESRDTRPRESLALRQEARTRRFGGRAAGGSHKSARGVPEISIFNRYSPDSRRFWDKVAPLAGLGNRKSYWLATPLAPLRRFRTFPSSPRNGEVRTLAAVHPRLPPGYLSA